MPGGKWEEGDQNDADTALREAKEEIGLDPSIVEVVTILEPFYTKVMAFAFPTNFFMFYTMFGPWILMNFLTKGNIFMFLYFIL